MDVVGTLLIVAAATGSLLLLAQAFRLARFLFRCYKARLVFQASPIPGPALPKSLLGKCVLLARSSTWISIWFITALHYTATPSIWQLRSAASGWRRLRHALSFYAKCADLICQQQPAEQPSSSQHGVFSAHTVA